MTEDTEIEINAIIGKFYNSSAGWDKLKPSLFKMIKTVLKAFSSYM